MAIMLRTAARTARRFIRTPLSLFLPSEEFPGEVETEKQTVRKSSACDLPERRGLRVDEIQLKHVSPRPHLDPEPEFLLARGISTDARRHFPDEVCGRRDPDPAAETDEKRIAFDV